MNELEFSEILPNLYLTGYKAINQENITKYRIGCIINVAAELPVAKFDGVVAMKFKFRDIERQNMSSYFNRICYSIARMQRRGKNVVVHCAAGRSRSVTIVLAYLMSFHKLDLRFAFKFVKRRRRVIGPNFGFFRQLLDYEMKLFHRNTVEWVPCRRRDGLSGYIPDVYLECVE